MNNLGNKTKICPICSYDANPSHFTKCELCGASLELDSTTISPSKKDEVKIFSSRTVTKISSHKTDKRGSKKDSLVGRGNKNWRILTLQNISGILLILLSIYLWRNHTVIFGKDEIKQETKIQLVENISDVSDVPSGIFSYSGDGYFAALLAEGLVEEIREIFPNFEFRYRVPANQNPSYSHVIDMLTKGEIDFVFNGRPLSHTERAKATLQNTDLQEVAIAIDGIVFYVNPSVSVERITVDQLRRIFDGSITNWQELGGEDKSIAPVILSQDHVQSLGFEVSSYANVHYVPNHTLAVRKVIDTEGAISYASASLVANQSLLKFLTLGKASRVNPEVINYTSPFIAEGKPNKQAFSQGTYPLVRRLFLVWGVRPSSIAAGTAMSNILLSYQGQEIIDVSGFVPLRKSE
ncbi:MAG: substrate-binding domain-containing protein [Xenococcaceae cyanobacterium MO_207.B15]|nr:substrate-binding domain-containing protein [Xenococcaceae cyanobacterium MO_207.B15]